MTLATLGLGMEQEDLPYDIYPLARCNDGTQANFFHDPGQPGDKILIELQGGGACSSIESCHFRCSQDRPQLCTARNVTEKDMGDFLTYGTVDPWKGYWHVFVHYCSSDTWSGTRAADEETGGYNFYGRHIFEAVINSLAENFNLLSATSIVLTGGSAGAQGVTWNCDYFAEWVWAQNPDIDVRCMPNAPEYYPPEVYTEGCYSREEQYQNNLGKFWGRLEDQSCLQFAEENNV